MNADLGLARTRDRRGQDPSFSTPAAVPAPGPVMKTKFDHHEAANSNLCAWLVVITCGNGMGHAKHLSVRAWRKMLHVFKIEEPAPCLIIKHGLKRLLAEQLFGEVIQDDETDHRVRRQLGCEWWWWWLWLWRRR